MFGECQLLLVMYLSYLFIFLDLGHVPPGLTAALNVTMIPYTRDIDYIRTTVSVNTRNGSSRYRAPPRVLPGQVIFKEGSGHTVFTMHVKIISFCNSEVTLKLT